ncbi:MAG: DUF3817 domain-containing protein [Deltaproteobacteria bacterium]
MKTAIGRLRVIGMIEGVSFLVLLGIAMPLKYLAGQPMAVKVVGWAHGVLFCAFCYALLRAKIEKDWGIKETAIPFIASLVPFGPFVIDRRLKSMEDDAA